MSVGSAKLSNMMSDLKKLPPERRAHWVRKLKRLETRIQAIENAKPLKTSAIESEPDEWGAANDWIFGLVNWLDKAYSNSRTTLANLTNPTDRKYSDFQLRTENKLEKVARGIAQEASLYEGRNVERPEGPFPARKLPPRGSQW